MRLATSATDSSPNDSAARASDIIATSASMTLTTRTIGASLRVEPQHLIDRNVQSIQSSAERDRLDPRHDRLRRALAPVEHGLDHRLVLIEDRAREQGAGLGGRA